MKKLLCTLLTLSLIFCTVAMGEEYNQNNSTASTTLTTTITDPTQPTPTYTIIIPVTMEITPNATSTQLNIQVTEMTNAKSVKVTTAESGSMTNGSEGTIAYTVMNNVLSWNSASQKWMSINIEQEQWNQAPAGEYTGTMSFTISAE